MKKTLEYFKDMNKKNKIVLASLLMGIILAFGAAAYAYFSVAINGESQPLSVQAGTLILEFNDASSNGIRDEEISLDNAIIKEMVIINTGTLDATATIMWNELENTYLYKSLSYTIKQTREYDKSEDIDLNTLEYNIDVPQANTNIPRSEEPKKTALTRGLNISAGKKIYYRVTITYNHLDDVDQTSDLEAQLSTSFTIEEGEQLEVFTITPENRSLIGYKGEENEELVIPATYQDADGTLYKVAIGEVAFRGSGLKSVEIQEGVTSINRGSFSDCYDLRTVTIGNGATSIGERAFYRCGGLSAVTLPDSITDIGNAAFAECEWLESINIPQNLKNIEDKAFWGCRNITSIIIPSSVTNIGTGAFYYCSRLATINIDEANPQYKSIEGVLFTKDEKTLIQFPPGKLDDNYTVPESVTSINSNAFAHCKKLTSIIIPDSVKAIGSSAFSNCRKLTSIIIPDGVASIGNHTFDTCDSLTSVTIPNSITSIGEWAFYRCNSLTSITLPNSVITILDRAFYSCDGLVSITLSDNITTIGYEVFRSCTNLESIVIPNSTTNIEYGAFQDCSSLNSVTMGNSVTNIGRSAFYGCSSLTSITIPDSVTTIGSSAFNGCSALISVSIGNGVKIIGSYAFNNCSNLESVIMGDNVMTIEACAFYNCIKIASITYKDTVYTYIGSFQGAFKSTSGNTVGVNAFGYKL